jgi:small subunit ribosomal protein S1
MSTLMDAAIQAALENPFPQLGELVEGIILDKTKNKCLVNLCDGQAVGVISGRETHDSSGTFKTLNDGDSVQAIVVEDENEEGFFVLSLRKAAQNTAWDRFENAYEKGEVFEVKVDEANKGGLLLEIDSIKAFLPVSQLAPLHYPRVNEANSQEILRRLQALIGMRFNVKIIAIDREQGKLILSERAAEQEKRGERLAKLNSGDVVEGKISGIVKFGLFVAFDGLEGLVHISEIAWGHVRNPADYGKLGDPVQVQVIGVEGEKISLSMKRLQSDPWQEAAKKYQVGTTIKGKINRITTFGAFVTLEKDINGLIHLSEITHDKVDDIDQFIKVGQEIEAEVINLDLEDHRIGLSMKKMLSSPVVVAADQEARAAEAAESAETDEDEAPSESAEELVSEPAEKDDKEGQDSQEEKTEAAGDDLTSVDGVTDKVAEHLKAAGIDSVEKLKAASQEELEAVEGLGPKKVEKIMASL